MIEPEDDPDECAECGRWGDVWIVRSLPYCEDHR